MHPQRIKLSQLCHRSSCMPLAKKSLSPTTPSTQKAVSPSSGCSWQARCRNRVARQPALAWTATARPQPPRQAPPAYTPRHAAGRARPLSSDGRVGLDGQTGPAGVSGHPGCRYDGPDCRVSADGGKWLINPLRTTVSMYAFLSPGVSFWRRMDMQRLTASSDTTLPSQTAAIRSSRVTRVCWCARK